MGTRVGVAHDSGCAVFDTTLPDRKRVSPRSARDLARAVVLALGLVPGIGGAVLPAPAAAQTTCEFVSGFARLRELVGPDVIGPCLEDQRTVLGGNAVQRTANGMLVWRLADNWIAFTDGYATWINGPNGLERRLNGDLFPWESTLA